MLREYNQEEKKQTETTNFANLTGHYKFLFKATFLAGLGKDHVIWFFFVIVSCQFGKRSQAYENEGGMVSVCVLGGYSKLQITIKLFFKKIHNK